MLVVRVSLHTTGNLSNIQLRRLLPFIGLCIRLWGYYHRSLKKKSGRIREDRSAFWETASHYKESVESSLVHFVGYQNRTKTASAGNTKAPKLLCFSAFRGSYHRYPQRGGYERQLPQAQTANPSNVYLLIINLNLKYSNDSRFLPVDTQAVLLLSVIFMRLMVETTCDE